MQRDRVFNSRVNAQPGEVAPTFPFEPEAVLTQAQINAHAQAQHMQQQQQVFISHQCSEAYELYAYANCVHPCPRAARTCYA